MNNYTFLSTGHSGYFSRPQVILDPQLFEGDTLLPHVRQTILDLFYNHMDTMFNDPHSWTMLWLAGSGVGYQWNSDRGNGDLDVLFGIDYDKFVTKNPHYKYEDRYSIAAGIDTMLKKHLWPRTAHTVFGPGETPYEVTYYANPIVEDYDESIGNINPYAAYNLTLDKWTTMPDPNPELRYPAEFEAQAKENRETAERLVARHKWLTQQLSMVAPGSPQARNWEGSMTLLHQHIRTMFDQIHLGRVNAFGPGGTGFGDFYNYQWQAAKRDGIVASFNEILNGE
jgi:hypothetical protein